MRKYERQLKKEDKVLYITNREVGNSIIQLALNQYIMLPIPISAVIPGTIGPIENLEKSLKEDGYTHVFVYQASNEAKQEYSSMFEENLIKEDTLYEVKVNEEKVKLIEVKKDKELNE